VGPLFGIWVSNSRKRLSVGNGKEPSIKPVYRVIVAQEWPRRLLAVHIKSK